MLRLNLTVRKVLRKLARTAEYSVHGRPISMRCLLGSGSDLSDVGAERGQC
jgi:hypothetical protein